MEITIGNNENKIEAKKITIKLSDDVDLEISIDKFGSLVINKENFGPGDSSINIKPRVSNEISIS